jgi:hypothetical protein
MSTRLESVQAYARELLGGELPRGFAQQYAAAAKLLSGLPANVKQGLALGYNMRADIDPTSRDDALAVQFGALALRTNENLADPRAVERLAAQGEAWRRRQVEGSSGKKRRSFLQSGRKLLRHPGKWGRAVLREGGKGIEATGRAVLKARDANPVLGKYFLDPLGFTAQATVVKNLGTILKTGRVSDFNLREVGYAAATTFSAAGTALVTAAPFLPAPWNVAAGALGALSIAAGKLLRGALDASKPAAEALDVADAADEGAYVEVTSEGAYAASTEGGESEYVPTPEEVGELDELDDDAGEFAADDLGVEVEETV